MGVICIFARADAAGFTLSVLKELRPERYRVAVENAMVSTLLSLANKMSPLPTVEKFDFAFWVVSKLIKNLGLQAELIQILKILFSH